MKLIESLTPEQIARFPEFVERWKKIGLSTEAADRPKAELASRDAYRMAKIEPPQQIVWFQGPMSLALGDTLIRKGLPKDIRASVRASVWASVWASVGDSVRDSVGASVRASVRASVWASVWDSVRDSIYGQHEAGWLSFYSYFLEVCNIEKCKDLLPLMHHAESSGWWIPRRGIILLSERPNQLHRDPEGRLHKDGGYAISYPDGWGVYSWHGVRLPEQYGAKHSSQWNPKWFAQEQNVEIKRVISEAIGYERLFQALEAKHIDSWREYELFRIENVDIEPMHILTMKCPSTGHKHFGRVPPDCFFAREAATLRNQGIDPETFLVEH